MPESITALVHEHLNSSAFFSIRKEQDSSSVTTRVWSVYGSSHLNTDLVELHSVWSVSRMDIEHEQTANRNGTCSHQSRNGNVWLWQQRQAGHVPADWLFMLTLVLSYCAVNVGWGWTCFLSSRYHQQHNFTISWVTHQLILCFFAGVL